MGYDIVTVSLKVKKVDEKVNIGRRMRKENWREIFNRLDREVRKQAQTISSSKLVIRLESVTKNCESRQILEMFK